MIELHLHLDGSVRPETVLAMGKEQGIKLPAETMEELIPFLRVPKNCQSLVEYLERFDLPLMLLQTTSALERVSYELIEDLIGEGFNYAEIRFAPQLHIQKGLSQAQIVASVIKGLNLALEKYKDTSFVGSFILCCMRGDSNHEANLETVSVAKEFLGKGVCAVDLAGAESLFPTGTFTKEFELAKKLSVPFTIHAGEDSGPESIRKALEFGAKRIGHGIHAIEDEELIKELVEKKITLEVCVISNIHSKCVENAEAHPIRRLFDKGVRVTINTDNRTVSNITLKEEIEFLKKQYGFTDLEIEQMQQYAFEARFCQ